jgi:elongation factor Ts
MMDCKKALEEAGGDVQAARENLRKKGQKLAKGREHRETREGRIAGYVNPEGTVGVMASLRCETEPVAKCEDFVTFLDGVISILAEGAQPPRSRDELLSLPHPSGKTVTEALSDLVGKIRENITIGDFSVLRGGAVFQYIHFNNRCGAMVGLEGGAPGDPALQEVGKNLCMHIVNAHRLYPQPHYLSREEIPPDLIEKEREILTEAAENDPKHSTKPPEIRQKIVEGQLKRFFSERCVPEQPYVKDDKISVEKYLKQTAKGVTLAAFCYLGLES